MLSSFFNFTEIAKAVGISPQTVCGESYAATELVIPITGPNGEKFGLLFRQGDEDGDHEVSLVKSFNKEHKDNEIQFYMDISLGKEGPTDSCLILHNKEHKKEYLIESHAWNVLSKYWDVKAQSGRIPRGIGLYIWDNRDDDMRVDGF